MELLFTNLKNKKPTCFFVLHLTEFKINVNIYMCKHFLNFLYHITCITSYSVKKMVLFIRKTDRHKCLTL